MNLKAKLEDKKNAPLLETLYGPAASGVTTRFLGIEAKFRKYYGEGAYRIFSAPGRTEIGGNHTDHNAGRVLAAAVSMDTVGFARANGTRTIRYRSEGYRNEAEFTIDLSVLTPVPAERNTTNAIIRGVASRMKALGYVIGGFDVYVSSTVLRGSGLSSSAAFETFIATVLDCLFNNGNMDPVEKAKISQHAENVFFGKPSGLMDQCASSVGGLVTIDFADAERPVVEKVDFDFASTHTHLVVVDTAGSHGALTDAYTAITREMKLVSDYFGADKLRRVNPEDFWAAVPLLMGKVPDRAILRAAHFFGDNQRVAEQVACLKKGDFKGFLDRVVASGESSWKLLQNLYVSGEPAQEIPLALAMAEKLLSGQGAWRVHGGGFAGTILTFVPNALLQDFVRVMDAMFYEGAASVLSIRPVGACEILL